MVLYIILLWFLKVDFEISNIAMLTYLYVPDAIVHASYEYFCPACSLLSPRSGQFEGWLT